jgi:hypothetical protein
VEAPAKPKRSSKKKTDEAPAAPMEAPAEPAPEAPVEAPAKPKRSSKKKTDEAPVEAPAEPAPAAESKQKRWERWTPTSTKIYAGIVEEVHLKITDENKKGFVSYLSALSEEEFNAKSTAGHMRDFVQSLMPVVMPASSAAMAEPVPDEDEDEDVIEKTFNGVAYFVGEKSHKIYQNTPAGDVQVGKCGIGRFAEFKPEF